MVRTKHIFITTTIDIQPHNNNDALHMGYIIEFNCKEACFWYLLLVGHGVDVTEGGVAVLARHGWLSGGEAQGGRLAEGRGGGLAS